MVVDESERARGEKHHLCLEGEPMGVEIIRNGGGARKVVPPTKC